MNKVMTADEVMAQQDRAIRRELKKVLDDPAPLRQMALVALRLGRADTPFSVTLGEEYALVGFLEAQKQGIFALAQQMSAAALEQQGLARLREEKCIAPRACLYPGCGCLGAKPN